MSVPALGQEAGSATSVGSNGTGLGGIPWWAQCVGAAAVMAQCAGAAPGSTY